MAVANSDEGATDSTPYMRRAVSTCGEGRFRNDATRLLVRNWWFRYCFLDSTIIRRCVSASFRVSPRGTYRCGIFITKAPDIFTRERVGGCSNIPTENILATSKETEKLFGRGTHPRAGSFHTTNLFRHSFRHSFRHIGRLWKGGEYPESHSFNTAIFATHGLVTSRGYPKPTPSRRFACRLASLAPLRKVPIGEGFECPKNARFQHGNFHHIHFNHTFQRENVILALKVENWIPGGYPSKKTYVKKLQCVTKKLFCVLLECWNDPFLEPSKESPWVRRTSHWASETAGPVWCHSNATQTLSGLVIATTEPFGSSWFNNPTTEPLSLSFSHTF